MTRRTLLETLLAEPERFEFNAAVAVLRQAAGQPGPAGRGGGPVHASVHAPVRFRAAAGLAFVASDVAAAGRDAAGFHLETGIIGLTGPSGTLPRPYTELVNAERRERSPALAEFLDLLAQRPIAAFAAAGVKYQPHRAARAAHRRAPGAVSADAAGAVPDDAPCATGPRDAGPRDAAPCGAGPYDDGPCDDAPYNDALCDDVPADGLRHALLALAGYGTDHLAPRLAAGTDPLLFYAGLFAAHPRPADSLAAMVSDWLGQPVAVEEFAGAWLDIDATTASALPRAGGPGQFNRLGVDAAIGARCWDIQSHVRLRIGPLPLTGFGSLQPDQPLFARLCSLVRAFLGPHLGFAVNLVLAAAEVPAPRLCARTASRLGWNTWLPTEGPRERDGTEPVFEAEGG